MSALRQPALRTLLSLLSLALAACSLPQVAPQKVQLVDVSKLAGGAYVDNAAQQSASEWPGREWWGRLGDPQLNQLVQRALQESPSLAVAQARIDQATAATGVAKAATRPTVGAEAKFAYNHFTELEFIPPPFGGANYWDNQAVLSASYDLDLWGKNRQALRGALDHAHAAQAEAEETREVLISAVVRNYVQLALQYDLKHVLEETLAQQGKILDLSKRRLRAGLGTELEVAQAESELPATRAQIHELEGNIAVLRHQLAALTGQGPGAGEQLAVPTLRLDKAMEQPATVPARWIGRRPDVIVTRWNIEAAGHDIEVAKARFYPDVNLSAFIGFQALGFQHFISGQAEQYGVTPAISLPIFEGGKLQAGLDAKSAEYDMAVAHYNDTVIKAMQQVANELSSLKTLAEQEKETRTALALAKKANDLSLAGMRAGLSDYTHVLQTEIVLLAQQRHLAQLNAQKLEAHVALIQAVGGSAELQGPEAEPKQEQAP